MTRKEIIEYLKSKNVEFNPTLRVADLQALYDKHSVETTDTVTPGTTLPPQEPETVAPTKKTDTEKLLEMMGTVVSKVGALEDRLKKVEGPSGNEFKNNAKKADIDAATAKKEGIDEKVVKIVEETLGIDFGIDLQTFADRPGFLFTVTVPTRLSDMQPSTRPVVDEVTGKYKVQPDGKTPVLEDYIPEDRRSRSIGSAQSYDAIRDHCNKVRSYLVSYYTKMSKPLPEFRIK